MRNRLGKYLLISIVLSVSAAVVNADHGAVPPLHIFTAGTTAKASEFNENFKYLVDRSWDLTPAPSTDLYYNDGKVGIGTTTPGQKLSVAGTIESTSGGFKFPDSTIQATAATGSGDGHSLDAADGTPTDALFVDDNGNVGIGVANPTSALVVQPSGGGNAIYMTLTEDQAGGADKAQVQIAPGSGTSTTRIGYLDLDFGSGANIRNNRNASLHLWTNNSQRMTITSGGNVGIASANPTYTLDVNGDINGNCVREGGTPIMGSCPSDLKLKKNIVYFTNSLEKLSALRPARFEWRSKEYPDLNLNSGSETGLIAQDVEDVFPNLVKTDEDGFKKISYGLEIQMNMIQAIKELSVTVNELQEIIGDQSSKLAEMEAKIAKLEDTLKKNEMLTAAQ